MIPQMYNSINSANVLKVAAVLIAGPRYVGAFGVSLGLAATELWPALIPIELATGAAMAILEGFAIAFMVSRWAKLRAGCWQWYGIAGIALILLATLPLIGLPYLLTQQQQISPKMLFAGHMGLQMAWSLVLLSVPILIVVGVALADYDTAQQAIHALDSKRKVAQAKADGQQKKALPYACECGKRFATEPAQRGHLANCKLRENGKANTSIESVRQNG